MSKSKTVPKEFTASGLPIVSVCHARRIRCAPRKMALVARLIRGKSVAEALNILRFTHRPSAVPFVERALKSAISNARDKTGRPEELLVGEVLVESAMMLKRMRPASMGRGVRVRKRTSHLHIALTQPEQG